MILLWLLPIVATVGAFLWIRERSQLNPKTKYDLPLPPYAPLSEFKPENPNDSTLEKAAAKYGELFAVRVPLWNTFVFFVGPNASKLYHMIKEEDASLTSGYKLFGHLSGQPKEYLDSHRADSITLYTRAFSKERYAHFAKLMRSIIVDYFKNEWNQDYQEVDIFPHIYNMTMDVIVKSFVGSDLTKNEITEFIELIKELDTEERLHSAKDVIKNNLPPATNHTKATWRRIKDFCRKIVTRRTSNGPISEDSIEFIDFMIKNCQDAKGEVDYDYLATIVFGLIFAATTNNFATAAWLTFFTLSKPELMKPLIQEQQEYLEMAKDPDADLSNALINKFNFTDMAIKETIRVCSGGIAMRRAMQDFVVDDKYTIPKGWYLVFPTFTVVHNTQVYDKPSEFNPNRMLTEGKGPCENTMFGAGRHPCIGAKFASMNIKTLVFNLLGQYDIEIPGPVEDFIPKFQNFGVYRPAQPVIFKLRKKL